MTGFLSAGLFADPLEVQTVLNGGSATIWVYEDTDQDGVAENVEEVALADGENGYELPSFSMGSGNDYWFYVQTEPPDSTTVVRIAYVTINA